MSLTLKRLIQFSKKLNEVEVWFWHYLTCALTEDVTVFSTITLMVQSWLYDFHEYNFIKNIL